MSAEGNDEWVEEARVWTQQARAGLCGILREALHGSVSTESFNENAFDQLERNWCTQQCAPDTDIRKQWQSMLNYVDTLPAWRRVGEGKAVRLMETAFFGGIRRLNLFGIPSTMLTVGAAHYAHKWFYPQWPTVKKDGIAIAKAVGLVFHERFWLPVKGIWVDLIIGLLAFILWHFTSGSFLQTIFGNIFLYSTLNSLLFNMNPLIKLDGY